MTRSTWDNLHEQACLQSSPVYMLPHFIAAQLRNDALISTLVASMDLKSNGWLGRIVTRLKSDNNLLLRLRLGSKEISPETAWIAQGAHTASASTGPVLGYLSPCPFTKTAPSVSATSTTSTNPANGVSIVMPPQPFDSQVTQSSLLHFLCQLHLTGVSDQSPVSSTQSAAVPLMVSLSPIPPAIIPPPTQHTPHIGIVLVHSLSL